MKRSKIKLGGTCIDPNKKSKVFSFFFNSNCFCYTIAVAEDAGQRDDATAAA